MNDEDKTFSITLDEDYLTNTGSEYTFNMSDITISSTTDTITLDPGSSGEVYNILDNFIDPDEVENMCKEYPALYKVWRNFKSVYDMTLQDYKGKKDEGALI
jgi:hypothetical protein|tara:strand:+ start:430 stop:735 length:306 start_codon:yes stop_codon:yes gene_type:complete